MEIQKDQIKKIQTICSSRFSDRDERLDFISGYFQTDIKSVTHLNYIEAEDLIRFLNTGIKTSNAHYATFDKANGQHSAILSICHQLGWVQELNPKFVDLHRLGSFIKSNRSPVQKPLRGMSSNELSKINKALEGILSSNKKYK